MATSNPNQVPVLVDPATLAPPTVAAAIAQVPPPYAIANVSSIGGGGGGYYPDGWRCECRLWCNCPDPKESGKRLKVNTGRANSGRWYHACPRGVKGDQTKGCGYYRFCRADIKCCAQRCDCVAGLMAKTFESHQDGMPYHKCANYKNNRGLPECTYTCNCTSACTPQEDDPMYMQIEQKRGVRTTDTLSTTAVAAAAGEPAIGKRRKLAEKPFAAIGGLLCPGSDVVLLGSPTNPEPSVVGKWSMVKCYNTGAAWYCPLTKELCAKFDGDGKKFHMETVYINTDWVEAPETPPVVSSSSSVTAAATPVTTPAPVTTTTFI